MWCESVSVGVQCQQRPPPPNPPGINTIKRHTQSKDFGVIRRLQLVDGTQMATGTGTFKWSFRCTYYKPDGYDSISTKKRERYAGT